MCSFSWREFDDHIAIAFNRDESVTRAKAEPPRQFDHQGIKYLMPIDPDGGGSWICVNQAGFAFVLLNNYQAKLKSDTDGLKSRGKIIQELALCQDIKQVQNFIQQLSLQYFQPFSLLVVSQEYKSMWCYNGLDNELAAQQLPLHWFSSAHPEADRVLSERAEAANNARIENDEDLILLHRSHIPNNAQISSEDRTFSICMHHERGHTQSLTYIRLENEKATMKYWNGQPCRTDRYSEIAIAIC